MILCSFCREHPAVKRGDLVYDEGRRETRYPLCIPCHGDVKAFIADLDALPVVETKDRESA